MGSSMYVGPYIRCQNSRETYERFERNICLTSDCKNKGKKVETRFCSECGNKPDHGKVTFTRRKITEDEVRPVALRLMIFCQRDDYDFLIPSGWGTEPCWVDRVRPSRFSSFEGAHEISPEQVKQETFSLVEVFSKELAALRQIYGGCAVNDSVDVLWGMLGGGP